MNIWKYLLDILFPPKCPFCGRVLDHPGICDACQTALPWIDDADAVRELPDGARCAAPLWYRDLARKGLLRFKFQGGSAAADPLGALIVQCAAEHLSGEFDTLSECARVLTQAGAASVVCAAAARTPREKVHSSVKE